VLRIIFLFLIAFDTNGVLDRYLTHDLVKVWLRSEAVNFGWYYRWEVDDLNLNEIRRIHNKLKCYKTVPPDEVIRYVIENFENNSFYTSMCFNYKCQEKLIMRMNFIGANDSDFDLLEEFQTLHRIYDLLDDINRPKNKLWEKRINCYDLKMLLGDNNYELGIIPSCVPLSAFKVIE